MRALMKAPIRPVSDPAVNNNAYSRQCRRREPDFTPAITYELVESPDPVAILLECVLALTLYIDFCKYSANK